MSGLITLGIGAGSTMQQFILVGLGKSRLPPPIYIGKKGKRSTKLARAHPRQAAWDRELAEVSAKMQDYRSQKEAEAQKVLIREQQRQQMLQKQAIKMRAAQMERDRLDADEVVTRKVVRQVVKEVLKEEKDK